ncbi:MAG: LysR family transcriptional regulator [Rhodospirillales bacterium]
MNSNDSTIIRNIDVSLARAFIATVETGGMTSAARLLNLTQGAVSQQIKRLEELLGKQLFDRSRRELTLTVDGERLLVHARRLITLNDEVWGLMNEPEFEGEIRFGVPRDLVRPFIPPVLRGFHDAWPRVHIDLVCDMTRLLRERMAEGSLDVMLLTEHSTPAHALRLMTDELVWIGSQDGRIHEEHPLPVATTSSICSFTATRVGALERVGRDWRTVGPVGDHDALLATVEAGIALSALLRSTVPDHLRILGADEGLPPLPQFHVNLYTRSDARSPVVERFAEHVRDQFARRFVSRPDIDRRAS